MAFCQNCGSSVEGRFCQKCGAAVGAAAPGGPPPPGYAPPPGAVPPPTTAAGLTDNAAGALCYLFGLITGILFLVLAPYNQNRNIKFHAFQAIFLHLGLIVCWILLTILSLALHVVPIVGTLVSVVLGIGMWIGAVVVWLYMMFKTYNGERIVLPIIGPLAEKQASN